MRGERVKLEHALIRSHRELSVYQNAVSLAVRVVEISKAFPKEETYSLTDQIRRSSRSVCANTAEAWRKHRYEAAFVAKISDAEGEAAETQVWIEMAVRCGYVQKSTGKQLYEDYDPLLSTLVGMIHHKEKWTGMLREDTADYDVRTPDDLF